MKCDAGQGTLSLLPCPADTSALLTLRFCPALLKLPFWLVYARFSITARKAPVGVEEPL